MTFQCLIYSKFKDGSRSAFLSFINDKNKQVDIKITIKEALKFIKASGLPEHKDINGIDSFYGFDPAERTWTPRYNH